MKKFNVFLLSVFLVFTFSLLQVLGKGSKELKITSIELGHPCPAMPFYHFFAEVELPHPSIIEVQAAVNGKVLRFTDLHRSDDVFDRDKPAITHRSPSAYAVSEDGTLYTHPHIVGWVRWEPGKSYDIRLTVRLKKNIKNSPDDVFITATKTVKAPDGPPVFDLAWKGYKAVVVSETAGVDRVGEPVEALLAFYPDEAEHLVRDIRVVEIDPETYAYKEIPSQVWDIMRYLKKDPMDPDVNGKPTRDIPLWMPTATARVAFPANVKAHTSKVYLVYYNNENAMAKMYETDLRVQGEAPGLRIDNDKYTIILHPNSGHLDQITLKTKPDFPLFHRMETNGAIHWNPGVYVPPRPWTHTADWKPPQHVSFVAGPVIATAEMRGPMREVPEVDASVRYQFYPNLPYFISSTTMRINKGVECAALRNGEIVFKRELMTHAAWYDAARDQVIVYDVANMPELTELFLEADVPWITFYNEKTGIGFAGIQLKYSNAGLENAPRLLNPYIYITGGPWLYWSRALSSSYMSSNMHQIIPALKGNFFAEKWAYLTYTTEKSDKPYAPVLKWLKPLTNPLRIRIVEEVDERVSRSLFEVYIDEGKSGWEGRSTGKH